MFASAKEKVTKVGSTATVVRNSVLIINYPILPFGIVACTIFSDNPSQNSCILTLLRESWHWKLLGLTRVKSKNTTVYKISTVQKTYSMDLENTDLSCPY